MITKNNYFILAAIVAVCVLAYFAILVTFGFAEHWGWLRKVCFILLTYVLAAGPLALLLKMWTNNKQPAKQ